MSPRHCVSFAALALAAFQLGAADSPTVKVTTPMPAPEWAKLERQLLAENVPACREFYAKYFDQRGYLQCFVRWGANDGPDDAFENFNAWPELHALGADDEIKRLYLQGHEGLIKQYTEAKTLEVPIARQGMYYKEFIVQSDWMHHGEGLQLFHRMGLSLGARDATYAARARRFAGLYMAEDPEAPNYDPKLKLIRSMQNGSRGPMLRKATALDWVGDSFDVAGFAAQHGESTYAQFLDHYREYGDVAGDHFINLGATTLPTVAYLVANEAKYKTWLVEYVDAWLDRMKRNGGVIPSFVDLDGKIGGPENKWWLNAYGWGFSPVNPVNGRREDRNRIPRAVVGFGNALLVTGDRKYPNAWRAMMDAVNSHARTVEGRKQYPTMFGEQGWYGWQNQPWSVGALDLWYWTMRADDRARVKDNSWLSYLEGKDTTFPETALRRDLESIARRTESFRKDKTPPEKRLADNMLSWNPAAITALTHLMQGGLVPGRDGAILSARLRYFDPEKKRAGVPPDVGALISGMTDTATTVTLVNLHATEPRTVIVQGGAYGEHRIESIKVGGRSQAVKAPTFTVNLAPGSGATLALEMKRYSAPPTYSLPWERN
ncbi:MAG TPA: hypothetical protein VM029_03855 [Opitutaceae bacterium]|nr:hypothetical protein [Opitutaceae bacterium]